MIENLLNKKILIVGMGKSGQSVARFCMKNHIQFIAYDDKLSQLDLCEIVNDFHLIPWIDHSIDLVIQSPGIKGNIHPVIQYAKKNKIPVLSDLDLFDYMRDKSIPCIGITGTNGKSTTTSLVAHILNEYLKNDKRDKKAFVGGNIGVPVLDLLGEDEQMPCSVAFYVLELSSYQLDITRNITLDISAFLNITADHIDYHGSFEAYQVAKEKIFGFSKKAIRPNNLVISQEIENLQDRCYLKGRHNLQNMQAAYEICKHLGVGIDTIYEAITTFKGIEHRQEIAFQNDSMIIINDSKATNADATETALKAFEKHPIFLILGGVAKEGGILSLKPYFKGVNKIYLIGEAEAFFSSQLKSMQIDENKIIECQTLEKAIQRSLEEIRNFKPFALKPVLLFSPACASFDQFLNFEDRGQQFKNFIKKSLPE